MNPDAEFDLIVYGATGYTGRLVAEVLARRAPTSPSLRWALAGRSAGKLAEIREAIGAPADLPLLVAEADDPAALEAMARRAQAVITTVGPYQLYGDALVAACVAAGTDCLDLSGEPLWMARMITLHDEAAQRSGARIVHSCGFDSIPFELGVMFCQQTAVQVLGAPVPRVKGRVRRMRGGLSGGTAASGGATMAAIQRDPSLMAVMVNPFALTPGFTGPKQPRGNAVEHDDDLGAEVGPFMMAPINTKNVHRSNFLQGHAWGTDFVYDEMAVVVPGAPASYEDLGAKVPQPGEGPSAEEREAGFYDLVFVGIAADGRKVKVSVHGDRDPGYGSTSKMLAETTLCLIEDAAAPPGGVWTPGAAMGTRLMGRLQARAGLSFKVEN